MGKDADSHPDCLHFWYRSELNTSRFETFFEGNLVKNKHNRFLVSLYCWCQHQITYQLHHSMWEMVTFTQLPVFATVVLITMPGFAADSTHDDAKMATSIIVFFFEWFSNWNQLITFIMVLLKSALCIVTGFVACLWASQDFRTAMFQASLIYTPGTLLRGSTHLLIEFAEFNHFVRLDDTLLYGMRDGMRGVMRGEEQ